MLSTEVVQGSSSIACLIPPHPLQILQVLQGHCLISSVQQELSSRFFKLLHQIFMEHSSLWTCIGKGTGTSCQKAWISSLFKLYFYFKSHTHFVLSFISVLYVCYREEQNLTTYWIWFINFNLCFLLLLFTKRILYLHNGLPQETLPLCLNVKPKCLCSEKHSDLAHLWTAARKKKLTHTQTKAGHSRRYMQE